MAKKKISKKLDINQANKISEFKPGDTPHYEYDGVVLNANVDWQQVILELQQAGQAPQEIADYAECNVNLINNILNKNYDGLNFRTGARLIALHVRHYPEIA